MLESSTHTLPGFAPISLATSSFPPLNVHLYKLQIFMFFTTLPICLLLSFPGFLHAAPLVSITIQYMLMPPNPFLSIRNFTVSQTPLTPTPLGCFTNNSYPASQKPNPLPKLQNLHFRYHVPCNLGEKP